MSVVLVRESHTYEAIQANDPEADEVLRRWFEAVHPGEDSSDVAVPEEAKEERVWFLRTNDGELAMIHPAVFVTQFETVGRVHDDTMAQFEAMLEETARVEEAVNERGLTPQQVIDNYITEKVALMLSAFEELEGASSHSEESAATGVEWSKVRFMEVFGVELHPQG